MHRGALRGQPADLLVVGGGVAGLVAARRAALAGARVVLVEAGDRLGGMLRRARLRAPGLGAAGGSPIDLEIDIGAEAFATRGGGVERLLGELGFGDEIVDPERRGSWGFAGGDAYCLPAAGLLGIPADPTSPEVEAALGAEAATRAAADRDLPVRAGIDARHLAELVESRMGRGVLDRFVTPVARGVYSLDPELLDHRRLAPGLAERVARGDTLAAAVAGLRAAAPPGAAVRGVRGGMWRVVERLEAELAQLGVEVQTGTRVTDLARDAATGTWTAVAQRSSGGGDAAGDTAHEPIDAAPTPPGESLAARAVLVTVDPASGIRIDGDPAPDVVAADTTSPDTIPAEVVALLVHAPDLDAFPRGTGVLVGEPSNGVDAKALTHVTAKWPWLAGRLPDGMHVVRLSYGPPSAGTAPTGPTASAPHRGAPGSRARTHHLDDAQVIALAARDASTLLGVPLQPDRVLAIARHEWHLPIPGARIGRAAELDRARDRAATMPGLALAGTWIDGTGLATVLPAAERAVDAVMSRDASVDCVDRHGGQETRRSEST